MKLFLKHPVYIQQEKIPNDFKKRITVMLTNKCQSTKCEQYRTLSIMTHTSKMLTKIILGRTEKRIDENLAEDQLGFRKNRATQEDILCLRKHCTENIYSKQKGIYCLC